MSREVGGFAGNTVEATSRRARRLSDVFLAEYSYRALFEPAEEGGFAVTCPALPGLVTEGDTMEEARAMASDAVRGYLESLRKDRLPVLL